MGCGKSTLGRALASMLSYSLVDLDTFIENKYFKTIPQIFANEGENEFRIKERFALEEVSRFENVIVSTGGGAPCFFDNINLMNNSGVCIFLDVNKELLIERLFNSKIERPLVKGKSQVELSEAIDELMLKRRPFYEKAGYILKGKEILPEHIIEIINRLK